MAKLILALVATVLVATASATMLDQVMCEDAVTPLFPCMPFLKGQRPKPSVPCCAGVQKLNGKCALKSDRVKVCQCLKDFAPRFGVDQARTKALPALCNVHLPFTIALYVHCNKIPM